MSRTFSDVLAVHVRTGTSANVTVIWTASVPALKSAIAAPPSLVGRAQTWGSADGAGPGEGDGGGGGEFTHGTVLLLDSIASLRTLVAVPQMKIPRHPSVVVIVFAVASHVNVWLIVQECFESPDLRAHGKSATAGPASIESGTVAFIFVLLIIAMS
jgi:hypothetical protein